MFQCMVRHVQEPVRQYLGLLIEAPRMLSFSCRSISLLNLSNPCWSHICTSSSPAGKAVFAGLLQQVQTVFQILITANQLSCGLGHGQLATKRTSVILSTQGCLSKTHTHDMRVSCCILCHFMRTCLKLPLLKFQLGECLRLHFWVSFSPIDCFKGWPECGTQAVSGDTGWHRLWSPVPGGAQRLHGPFPACCVAYLEIVEMKGILGLK